LTDGVEPGEASAEIIEALSDDLNTAGVISVLHKLAGDGDASGLSAGAQLIGLLTNDLGGWEKQTLDLSHFAEHFAFLREKAMQTKDFSAVDEFKRALTEAGVEVRLSKTAVELLPKPIESVKTVYARSNQMRDDLNEMNYWLDVAENMRAGKIVCLENREDKLAAVERQFLQ
jgi:cysteinyl-tRNA synthetase